MSNYAGGCACGAIRYRFSNHADAGFCHCSSCRRSTGAPVVAWALVEGGELSIEQGEPAAYESRRFCSTCGSSLFRLAGDNAYVLLASLDEPKAIEPRIHQCIGEQLPWLRLDDRLPAVHGSELTPLADRHIVRGPAAPSVTRNSTVTLRPVTKENLSDVLYADVAGAQRRLVAANSTSIAQGLLADHAWMRAIYADDTVVGFAMAIVNPADEFDLPLKGDPDLWRFMIDDRYQGLGFGARALEAIVEELRTWDGARNIWLSCVPWPNGPYEFYRRFGFDDTGVIAEGELVMRLPVDNA